MAPDVDWSGLEGVTLAGGTLARPGDFSLEPLTWQGGTLSGSGRATVPAGASLELSGSCAIDAERIVENSGSMTLSSGASLSINPSGIPSPSLVNLPGAVFEMAGTSSLSTPTGTSRMLNEGLLKKTGAGTATLGVYYFDSTGAIDVESGVLQLRTIHTIDGELHVAPDAALEVGGYPSSSYVQTTLAPTLDLNVEGKISVSAGRLVIPSGVDLSNLAQLELAGGIVEVQGALDMSRVTWKSGSLEGPGEAIIPTGFDFNLPNVNVSAEMQRISNHGALRVQDGHSLLLTDSDLDPILHNAPEGTIDLGRSGVILSSSIYSDARIDNEGLIVKQAGSQTAKLDVELQNTGVLDVRGGTLQLSGGGSNLGSLIVAPSAALDVGKGTFVIESGSDVQIDGTLRIGSLTTSDEGTVRFNDPADLDDVARLELGTSTSRDGVRLQVVGDFLLDRVTWNRGALSGPGVATIPSHVAYTLGLPGALCELAEGTIRNEGTLVQRANLRVDDNALIVNASGATYRLETDVDITEDIGGDPIAFDNQGALIKTASTGRSELQIPFLHTGSVSVLGGTLALTRGGTHAASYEVAPTATLELGGGTHTLAGDVTMTGGGLLAVVAPTSSSVDPTVVTGPGSLTTSRLSWSGGALENSGQLTISAGGSGQISGTARKDLDAFAIDNAGDVTLSGSGALQFSNGAVWNNLAGSLLDLQSDASVSGANGGGVVNNYGVLRKSLTGGATSLSAPLHNFGLLDLRQGSLNLTGGGTHAGDMQLAAGTTLTVSNNTFRILEGAAASGPGGIQLTNQGVLQLDPGVELTQLPRITMNGGTLQSDGDYALSDVTWNSGAMAGAGTNTIAAAEALSLGGTGARTLNQRTVVNQGTVTWSGGTLAGSNGARWINAPGSTFDAQTSASMTSGTGTQPEFYNFGTLRKSLLPTATTSGFAIHQQGTIEVQAGTLRFTGGGSLAGHATLAPGAALDLTAGTFRVETLFESAGEGALSVSGSANVLGGGSLLVERLEWSGGTLAGAGTLEIGEGPSRLTGASAKTLDERMVLQFGDVAWSGSGPVVGGNGAAWIVGAGQTLSLASDAAMTVSGTSLPSLLNVGALSKTGGLGASQIDWALSNRGVIRVESGELKLLGPITEYDAGRLTDGTWEVRGNARLSFAASSSVVHNDAHVVLAGPVARFAALDALESNAGLIRLEQGQRLGTAGSLSNSGVISLDAESGLSVAGNLALENTGSLAFELGLPTSAAPVAIAGDAVLAGTLELSPVAGYVPEPGDEFILLLYSNYAGEFDTILGADLGGLLFFVPKYEHDRLTVVVPPPGDANLDRHVTGADFTVWSDNFGAHLGDARYTDGDFNGDGFVTGADFTIWSDHFGAEAPLRSMVPEPSAAWLACVGVSMAIVTVVAQVRRLRLR